MKKRIRLLILIILIVILIPVGVTFSKYIYNFAGNYIMELNHFYFNSDKLTANGKIYNLNNWGGVGTFPIDFSLNNHKNNILKSDSDIEYTIQVNVNTANVTYSIDSNSGILTTSELTDDFTLTIIPGRVFTAGESLSVTITATSSSPYVKTLSATFIMTVGRQGLTYAIDDEAGQPYLNFTITNARDNYTVFESFDGHVPNTDTGMITPEEYMSLSDINKAKCYSARITLTFDPRVVVIDTTSNLFKNATYTTTNVDGVLYVSSVTFDVESLSSTIIRFYKKNVSNDYTYPDGVNTPIITFNAL